MKRNLDQLSTKLTSTLLSPGNESTPGALAYTRDTDRERLLPALELAEKIAQRSNATTNGQNAAILDTLARVLFLKGQWETAVDLQETAVRLAQGRQKSQFRETLGIYNKHELPKPN